LVYLREIDRTALWEFCKIIGTFHTWAIKPARSAYGCKAGNALASVDDPGTTKKEK